MATVFLLALMLAAVSIAYVLRGSSVRGGNTTLDTDSQGERKTRASVDAPASLQTETLVAESPEKIVVQYRAHDYDLTKFAIRHPGGKKVLLDSKGLDIEALMIENNHSKHAYRMLEKYRVKTDTKQ